MATEQLGSLLRYVHKLAAGSLQRTDRELLDHFSARRDEAAFAALVARHGPMVLQVCRRVLKHEQDAEDAFQATFLILARKGASIRKPEALAEWLHGAAYRTAMEVKRSAARRRNHEARLWTAMRQAAVSPSWNDVQAVLDEEIHRLPETYRAAFVLCVLEGKSGPQAAVELGVKEGAIWTRLTRARQLLQRRLMRRGIKLAAVLAALTVGSAAQAGLPAVLTQVTVRFGLLLATGEPAAGLIPTHIAALAAGVTRAMFLTKAKIATAVLFAIGLLAGGAGILTHQTLAAKETTTATLREGEAPAEPPRAKKEARDQSEKRKPASEDKDSITYSGRVLDPDGQPVAGAKLYVTLSYGYPNRLETIALDATTGADGRFKFIAPRGKYPSELTCIGAMTTNYGAGWVTIPAAGKREDLTLHLVKDDVPITGQIVDLEGKPVSGATLRLREIRAAPGEDLGPWLEAVKASKGPSRDLEWTYLTLQTLAVSGKATTDDAGRFRLTGIGRNRLVQVQLEGPTVASQVLHILTRPGAAIEVTEAEARPQDGRPRTVIPYYGANFRHPAAPTKPIIGVVRDKDTKRPLAGFTIESHIMDTMEIVRTTTDSQGCYRLTGKPKATDNVISVLPPRDLPYVAVRSDVPDTEGLEPVIVDFEMKRGVWIEGKISDKTTRKPVVARVEYFAQETNSNLSDYPGFQDLMSEQKIIAGNEDGSYRVLGLPGPGLVAVYSKQGYLRAPERDDEYGTKHFPKRTLTVAYHPGNFTAFASIDPAKGMVSIKRDVTLDPGWTFTGTVLGPDGNPLIGARGFEGGLRSFELGWEQPEGMKTAQFTIRGFNPRRPRDIFFQHSEKGLVGMVRPPQENGGSVTVKMEPGAAVTGRLVDEDGQPRAGVQLQLTFFMTDKEHRGPIALEGVRTDREGRFRIGLLLPKYEYHLSDGKGGTVSLGGFRSGKTKDLGDVQLTVGKE